MAYEICSSVHTLYSAILQLRRTHTHTHTIGALGGIGDGGGEAKDYDVLPSHRSTRKHRNHRMYHINACVCTCVLSEVLKASCPCPAGFFRLQRTVSNAAMLHSP